MNLEQARHAGWEVDVEAGTARKLVNERHEKRLVRTGMLDHLERELVREEHLVHPEHFDLQVHGDDHEGALLRNIAEFEGRGFFHGYGLHPAEACKHPECCPRVPLWRRLLRRGHRR